MFLNSRKFKTQFNRMRKFDREMYIKDPRRYIIWMLSFFLYLWGAFIPFMDEAKYIMTSSIMIAVEAVTYITCVSKKDEEKRISRLNVLDFYNIDKKAYLMSKFELMGRKVLFMTLVLIIEWLLVYSFIDITRITECIDCILLIGICYIAGILAVSIDCMVINREKNNGRLERN